MSATHRIPVPDDLYRELSQRAGRRGISPEQWASTVLAEHARLERLSDEYFDRRAKAPVPALSANSSTKPPTARPTPATPLKISPILTP